MESHPTGYEVYLRFSLGSDSHNRGFPIGEHVYATLSLGKEIVLPHHSNPFFKDLPQAYIEALEPSVLGELPKVHARIRLSSDQENFRVITSLFYWYQNPSQLEFSLPGQTYAQTHTSQRISQSKKERSIAEELEKGREYKGMIRRARMKIL